MCGGLGDDRPSDVSAEGLFDGPMLAAMGVPPSTEVIVIKYATQVVAGTVYFAKVELMASAQEVLDIVHVRIFKPLPHTGQPAQLQGLLKGMTIDSEIEFFQGFNH
jgi:hypothetical protein